LFAFVSGFTIEGELVRLRQRVHNRDHRVRLEYCPKRHDCLDRVVGEHRYPVAALNPAARERASERIRARVDLGVGQALPLANQRDLLR
jgi:hypothetical protein